jgi:hypothetical protein
VTKQATLDVRMTSETLGRESLGPRTKAETDRNGSTLRAEDGDTKGKATNSAHLQHVLAGVPPDFDKCQGLGFWGHKQGAEARRGNDFSAHPVTGRS